MANYNARLRGSTPKAMIVKLASHDSWKENLTSITERLGSSNVVISEQPQWVAFHRRKRFFRRKHYISLAY